VREALYRGFDSYNLRLLCKKSVASRVWRYLYLSYGAHLMLRTMCFTTPDLIFLGTLTLTKIESTIVEPIIYK
jgi:hypothetical protein